MAWKQSSFRCGRIFCSFQSCICDWTVIYTSWARLRRWRLDLAACTWVFWVDKMLLKREYRESTCCLGGPAGQGTDQGQRSDSLLWKCAVKKLINVKAFTSRGFLSGRYCWHLLYPRPAHHTWKRKKCNSSKSLIFISSDFCQGPIASHVPCYIGS